MPPKSKKASKKAGAIKEKPPLEKFPECDTERYLAKIRDLEDRLLKCQRTCSELEIQEKNISAKYNSVEVEKKDLVNFLKKRLADAEDKNACLSKKLYTLQEEKGAEKADYENRINMLLHFEIENKKMQQKNNRAQEKIASMEKICAEYEELKDQIALQKKEEEPEQHEAEKDAMSKKKLKHMLHHRTLITALQHHPDPANIQKEESYAKDSEIRQLSDQMKNLLAENNTLRSSITTLKEKVAFLKAFAKKTVEPAVAKQKKMLDIVTYPELQIDMHLQKFQQLLNDHSVLQKRHEDLRGKYTFIMNELAKTTERGTVSKDLQEEKQLQTYNLLQEGTMA